MKYKLLPLSLAAAFCTALLVGLAASPLGPPTLSAAFVPETAAQINDDPPVSQAIPRMLPGFPATDSRKTISFGSPTVVDLNGDGQNELLVGDNSGCVWGWDEAGEVLNGFPLQTRGSCNQSARIRSSVAVGDIDGDGDLEIVVGTRGIGNSPGQRGLVFAWHHYGSVVNGWPVEMDWNSSLANGRAEVYSVLLANVAGDEALEVIAGTSNNAGDSGQNNADTRNLYVWHGDGTIVAGYPTWFRTAGIFGAVAAGDVVGDHHTEVFVGRDHIYVHGYDSSGDYLSGDWPHRTYVDPDQTVWGVDRYLEFTSNGPVIGDLDNDGTIEVVIAGKVRDPLQGHSTVTAGLLVLQADGSRRPGWEVAVTVGPDVTAGGYRPGMHPALADLDGDGTLEIIVTLYDGTARAFRHDGTQQWSFDFAQGRVMAAGEPVVGDVTGDADLEILFGTYSPDDSAEDEVGIYALNNNGQLISGYPLPLASEHLGDKKGVRGAPTIADVDCDGDTDLAVASRAGILYVWEMGTTFEPENNPWPTGRHDNQRSAAFSGSQTRSRPPLPMLPFSATSTTFFPVVSHPFSCLAYP